MGDAALAELEETHDVVVGRVLKARDQGHGLDAYSVNKHIVGVLPCLHPVLDIVVCKQHSHPEEEEGSEGKQKVCHSQDYQDRVRRHCHAIYEGEHKGLAYRQHAEASELPDGHVADDDPVGPEGPYQEEGRGCRCGHPHRRCADFQYV